MLGRFTHADLPIELPRELGLHWATQATVCAYCGLRRANVFVIGTLDHTHCPRCGAVDDLGFSIQSGPFHGPECN